VKRISQKTNALIRLPADSSEGKAKAKEVQEAYQNAFAAFAQTAGEDLAIKVKRGEKLKTADALMEITW